MLPERPTQVKVRSEMTDRSMIRREMARARDVGLLSEMAFDSKSNYFGRKSKFGNLLIKISRNDQSEEW